jgi:hypothetical protein
MNAPSFENRTISEMFSRGFWMMLGPLLLVPFAIKIIEYGNGWLTPFDFIFVGTLIAMILARGFEFYKGHPRTAEGAPATQQHFWRYVLWVGILGSVAWIVANLVGNYVLAKGP